MTDEKLVDLMGEARLIAASENVLYPMIDKKISEKIIMACGKFLNGEKDFIGEIAYIAALNSIKDDLKSKQLQGNKAIKALHEDAEKTRS